MTASARTVLFRVIKMGFLFFFIAALFLSGRPAHAVIGQKVDDTGTWALSPTLQMHWDTAAPRRGAAPTLSAVTTVSVHLNVIPWRGKSVRVDLVLPDQPAGPLSVSWQSATGRLLPGTVHAGARALVYAGPITADAINDQWRMSIQADGRFLTHPQSIAFSFEARCPAHECLSLTCASRCDDVAGNWCAPAVARTGRWFCRIGFAATV